MTLHPAAWVGNCCQWGRSWLYWQTESAPTRIFWKGLAACALSLQVSASGADPCGWTATRSERAWAGPGAGGGGDGGVRRVRFLEPMTASILSNGRRRCAGKRIRS